MQDPYKDSFSSELPKLKNQEDKEVLRAAVLRFINEIRKEIVDISTKNNTKSVTGEVEVGCEPKIVIPEKSERKTVYIKNVGQITCKVYGINESTTGTYPLDAGKELVIHGANAIAISTVSGMSIISYLDS